MQPSSAVSSLSASRAAEFLGIKPQTLYAYASRGLLRRVGTGKRRQYLLEDLERLRARQRARSGHGPVAAAALSFGEPVLDTSITAIDESGPRYRGQPALSLAESGTSFEAAFELLCTGALPVSVPPWRPLPAAERAPICRSLSELAAAVPALGASAPAPLPLSAAAELEHGRSLIRSLAALLLPARARRAGGSIAELLSASGTRSSAAALDLALVLLADHELNASSFTARVAASTGAELWACVTAALATLSGPRHGGACARVEALLDEAAAARRPTSVIQQRAQRGDIVPGFGHPLYPHGDPRARPLLARARALSTRNAALRTRLAPAFALATAMERVGLPPTVDFGLVALTRALGMGAGSASLLFAVGRSAGWVAHVLEQRGSDAVLRPRARYVGA
jgi:citrate synthase